MTKKEENGMLNIGILSSIPLELHINSEVWAIAQVKYGAFGAK